MEKLILLGLIIDIGAENKEEKSVFLSWEKNLVF